MKLEVLLGSLPKKFASFRSSSRDLYLLFIDSFENWASASEPLL